MIHIERVTFIFNSWGHKELKSYLESLKGVKKADIDDEAENLTIDIDYEAKEIGPKVLELEIATFMQFNIPSLISFNKHFKGAKKDIVLVKDVCCEYCYMDMIEELFNTNGIMAAWSDYEEINYHYNISLHIEYDPRILTKNDIKKLEEEYNED